MEVSINFLIHIFLRLENIKNYMIFVKYRLKISSFITIFHDIKEDRKGMIDT